jgi:flagellar hook-length control protein FliK
MLPKIDPKLNILSEIHEPNAINRTDITKREINSKLSQLIVGKDLLAEVLAKRPDGSYLIKVADLTFKSVLPNPVKPGERFNLTPLTLYPNTSFLLSNHEGKPYVIDAQLDLQTNAYTQNNKNLLTNRNELGIEKPQSKNIEELNTNIIQKTSTQTENSKVSSSTDLHLSTASQLINQLLQETLNGKKVTSSLSPLPLLNTDETVTPQVLIPKLSQALEKSGLFYESHVAKWSLGQLPLHQLQHEAEKLGYNAMVNLPPSINELPSAVMETLRQQLHLVEQQTLTWQGMLNSQTPMQWRIHEETDMERKKTSDEQEQARPWLSQLILDFPHLGKINVQLRLHEDQLQADFKLQENNMIDAVRLALPNLKSALNEANIQLTLSKVSHDD